MPLLDPEFAALLRRHLPSADGVQLSPDTPLRELGLNSLHAVDLLFDLEETFGVELPDNALSPDAFATPGGLWSKVMQSRNSRVAALEGARKLQPVLRDSAAETDESASFPVAALSAIRSTPLMGLLVPAEYGGLGGSLADLASIAQELARGSLSAALIWAMHGQQVATLAEYAGPALKARILPSVAAGQMYIASVTSETGKGGDLNTAMASLARDADNILIDREAPVVTGGAYADGFLMTMRDADSASPSAVTLVFADREQMEITQRSQWNPMGMRATHSIAMRLRGTVPSDQQVGAAGGFKQISREVFAPAAHIGWSACWLGAVSGVLSDMLTMLRDPGSRRDFDLTSNLVLDRLARIRLDVDAVHAFLMRVVTEVEELRQHGGDLGAIPVQLRLNGLKVFAAETLMRAADKIIDLLGFQLGYLRDSPIPAERLFRDLKSARLNYSNDRLTLANGTLALLDPEVQLG